MSMSYLLGKVNLRAFRYCVLIVFLICNALVSSISVWNLGLVRGVETSDRAPLLGIDSYSTFLGCSGLVLSFIIAFVEIVQTNCFLALVWFECFWVSLWGLMYFVSGITLSVIASQENCNINDSPSKCISTEVMLAFTWLCAVSLLIYLSVFVFAILINQKKDTTIWLSTMRKFPWSGTCVILAGSPSPTPQIVQSVFPNSVPIIRAPKPRHARPNPNQREPIFSWRSGLSDEYQIEHFKPTNVESGPSQIANLPPAATAPIVRASVLPALGTSVQDNFASSLYPPYLQHTVLIANSEPAHSQPVLNQSPMRTLPSLPQAKPSLFPSPLGDWPRRDIIARSVSKGKRKQASVPHSILSVVLSPSASRVRQQGERQHTNPSSFSLPKPMGPRRRSGSSDMTDKAPM